MMQVATCWTSRPVAMSTDDSHRRCWHCRSHFHWDCRLHQVWSASVRNHYCCSTHYRCWIAVEGPAEAYHVVGSEVCRPIQTLPATVPVGSETVGCYTAAVDQMTCADAVAPVRAALFASEGSWSAVCGSYRCYLILIWHCLARSANPDADYPAKKSENLSTTQHRSDQGSEIGRS